MNGFGWLLLGFTSVTALVAGNRVRAFDEAVPEVLQAQRDSLQKVLVSFGSDVNAALVELDRRTSMLWSWS